MPAFARTCSILLLVVTAFVLAACGSDDDAPKTVTETETTTTTATTDKTATGTSQTTVPAKSCSALHLDGGMFPQAGLPPAVAKTREELFDAAISCNYDELQAIADRNEDGFAYSYGDQSGTAAEYWRTQDPKNEIMRQIVQILNVEYVDKRDDGPRTFAWPSVHATNPPAAAWKALADSNVYPADQIAGFQRDGTYYGLRIGIRPDGRVTYIVAGD